jgi:glycosyltransferase involved in cell wall biosynthesis
MKDGLISVLMPVYNAADFLKASIGSILAQTYKNFELIIINDGSTDGSEAVVQSFADPRIKYYYQANAGVANTLNRGISLAAGDYIWRHDADDISLPAKLEKELAFLEDHPEFSLCACQVAFMTESGKVAWSYRQPANKVFGDQPFIEVTRAHFDPYSPITHGTVLVRTGVMQALGGYRAAFITGEDVDCWLRLIQGHRAAVINQCLSFHRLNKTSATQVHGWKNEFFRNLAFKLYDQRVSSEPDDLQRNRKIVLPEAPPGSPQAAAGRRFRNDLLLYQYPLSLNAGDWPAAIRIVQLAVKDGWKLSQTWKAILLPLLPKNIIAAAIKIKRLFKL